MALGATGTWIDNTRTWFMNELAKAAGVEGEELSDEALSPRSSRTNSRTTLHLLTSGTVTLHRPLVNDDP